MPDDSGNRTADYRERIFEAYASLGKTQKREVSLLQADRLGKAYAYYLRGWLPAELDAPVVDVGCGFGRLLRFFVTRGYTNVQGVDISAEQVELARTIHPNVEQANLLDFLRGRREAFALITAFDVIEHLHKDEVFPFLDACFSALRPGGHLVLQTPNADSPWCSTIRYGDFTHEVVFNASSLRWVTELAGFKGFEAREQGPAPYGVVSTIRFVLWQVIHYHYRLRNTIETGSPGSRVYSRVFLTRARRPM